MRVTIFAFTKKDTNEIVFLQVLPGYFFIHLWIYTSFFVHPWIFYFTLHEGFPLFGDYILLSEICENVLLVSSTLFFVLPLLHIPSGQFLNGANKKLFKCNKSVRRTCSRVNALKILLIDLFCHSVNDKKFSVETIDNLFLLW